MKQKLALLVAIVIASSLVGNASAHKSQVIGDYEIEVGWENEPPIIGKENAIVIMITHASHEHTDEMSDEEAHDEMSDEEAHDEMSDGVTGLASVLDVTIKLNDEITVLEMTEDEDTPGLYIGSFTPNETGHSILHLVTTIEDKVIEIDFHPEEVESHFTSPLDQQLEGTSPNEVECNSGLTLLAKTSNGSAICVKPQTAEILLARGLATNF